MTDIVERVAKAIYESYFPDRWEPNDRSIETALFRQCAQAALAVALPRQPSDGQLEAGKAAVYSYTGLPDKEPRICCAMGLADEVYRAMRDAA